MFQLDKHNAVLANLNLRKENHGDEKKAAADLKFTLAAPNTLLDSIDKALRPAFFRKPGKGEQQALPIEGGSISMSLTVSVQIDEDDDAPLLAAWRRGEAKLSLVPPKAQAVGDTLDQQDAEAAKAEAARLVEKGKQAA